MSSSNRGQQSAERKIRRSLDFFRSRGVEEMGPTTRSQAAKHSADAESANPVGSAMESESLQGAVGGAWSQTGTIPKPQRSELPVPEKLSGQQKTYRTAMSTQLSEFQAEIRREMLAFMLEIQNTVKSSRLGEQAPPNHVQEPAVSVPPAHGAAPNYANNWMDSRALETQQRQQAGYRDEQQNQTGPPESSTSGRAQSWKDPGQVRRRNLKFDGSEKSMPVKEFIFRVEHMQRVYQLPWAEVIRDFHLLVDGRARDWFWMHARTGQMMDWPNLRYSLQKQFQTRKSSFEQEQELRERRQRPGVSVEEYLQEMLALRSRLDTHFPDRDLIKVIKVNIKDSISRVIYPMHITSLEMLRDECHDAEKWVANRWSRPVGSQPPLRPFKERHQVQEVYASEPEGMPDEEPAEAVEALYRPRPGGGEKAPPLVCWNCAQGGHTFWECESPVRNIFCYRCGQPEVVLTKCPRCQSGNSRQGRTRVEESCSAGPATQ
ncbi:hypothetical protein ACLKA6_001139 [Drosophila palustris]